MQRKFKLKLGMFIAGIFFYHNTGATQLPLTNSSFEEYILSQRTYCLMFPEDEFYHESLSSRETLRAPDFKKKIMPKLHDTLSEAPKFEEHIASSSKDRDIQ